MQPNSCSIRKIKDDMSGAKASSGQDEISAQDFGIIRSALQVGGLTGLSGLLVGGIAGVVRSSTPKLFAVATSIQWFVLGSTFWGARNSIIYSKALETQTPRDKVTVSATAGALSGGIGGLLRGPRNVVPGALMFALLGAGGQAVYNTADARHTEVNTVAQPEKKTWMDSRWSPMTRLSDEDYGKMLREKLLRIDADIALVDEHISRLKEEEARSNDTSR